MMGDYYLTAPPPLSSLCIHRDNINNSMVRDLFISAKFKRSGETYFESVIMPFVILIATIFFPKKIYFFLIKYPAT